MKRRAFIWTTVLAILLGSSLPYVCGIWAAHRLKTILRHMPKSSEYRLDILDIDQHWLSSDVHWVLTIFTPELRKAYITLTGNDTKAVRHGQIHFTEHYLHGPIIFPKAPGRFPVQFGLALGSFKFGLGAIGDSFVEVLTGKKFTINIEDQLPLMNGIIEDIYSHGIQFNIIDKKDPIEFNWDGFNLRFTVPNDYHQQTVFLLFHKLSIKFADFISHLSPLTVKTTLTRSLSFLWPKSNQAHFANLSIQYSNELLRLENFKFSGNTSMDQKYLTTHHSLQLAKLTLPEVPRAFKKLGPIHLSWTLSHLDKKAFKMLLEQFTNISDMDFGREHHTAMAILLEPVLMKLLQHGAILEFNIEKFHCPKGDLRLTSTIKFDKTEGYTAADLEAWLMSSDLKMKIRISEPLLKTIMYLYYKNVYQNLTGYYDSDHKNLTKQQIERLTKRDSKRFFVRWLTSGGLILDDKHYVLTIHYANYQLKINNKVFPVH